MEVPAEFPNDLPVIDIKNRHVPEVTQEAWEALTAKNQPPYLFRYGNQVVRLVFSKKRDMAIEPLDRSRLRHELTRAAVFGVDTKNGLEICPPPSFVVEDMLADPNPPLPFLERVVDAPIFSRDGQLQNRPGYCPSTRCYLNFNDALVQDVPLTPSDAEIAQAKAMIDELIDDFPFTGQAEKAHAVLLCLSPFVRPMIQEPAPITIVEAPSPGTGKTLLTKVVTYPANDTFISLIA